MCEIGEHRKSRNGKRMHQNRAPTNRFEVLIYTPQNTLWRCALFADQLVHSFRLLHYSNVRFIVKIISVVAIVSIVICRITMVGGVFVKYFTYLVDSVSEISLKYWKILHFTLHFNHSLLCVSIRKLIKLGPLVFVLGLRSKTYFRDLRTQRFFAIGQPIAKIYSIAIEFAEKSLEAISMENGCHRQCFSRSGNMAVMRKENDAWHINSILYSLSSLGRLDEIIRRNNIPPNCLSLPFLLCVFFTGKKTKFCVRYAHVFTQRNHRVSPPTHIHVLRCVYSRFRIAWFISH